MDQNVELNKVLWLQALQRGVYDWSLESSLFGLWSTACWKERHNSIIKIPGKRSIDPMLRKKSCFHIFIGLVVIQTQANFICGMKSEHFRPNNSSDQWAPSQIASIGNNWYCWWDKQVYNLVIAFQLLSQCATLLPFHHQAANLIFLNRSFGFVIWGAVWGGNFCLLSLHFNDVELYWFFCF